MRSTLPVIFAGMGAAFFYCSIFFHAGVGQLLWPLASIPLFMVTLSRPASDGLLALAGAGVLVSLFSLLGVFPANTLQTFGGFLLSIGVPALLAGMTHQALTTDGQPVRGEPLIALLIFLALALFFISAGIFMLMGEPLHILFGNLVTPLAETMHQELKKLSNGQLSLSVAELSRAITWQIAAFMPLAFVFIQGICLLISRWLLVGLTHYDAPSVKLSPLQFPIVISFLFFAMMAMYTYILNQMPENPLGFYTSPVLTALALPLAAQGGASLYEKFIKNLSQAMRYGVYMGILIMLVFMPLFTSMVLILLGVTNQLYMRKTKNNLK